ncbi:MAG: Serine phosphatase RsbU, regulator of sigma subunit [uncultured Solirubrobacteraceae bacterium]|uniref:Serine phosphatase RsbU, regulator of sigma subunit n=1 Tax=uncultured Solirubrobacteraceae bacterium TaxID=1162706 RepID=A0A6J4SLH9_9ACTN|nr:MAG: Serine phosphatase RsbU, regulator of sigma subunit [uncultured Solirubrobacteraceae bacterium]
MTRRFGESLLRALAGARTGESATGAVLGELVKALGGRLAVLWLLDPRTGLLGWQADHSVADEPSELRDMNRRLTFAPGVGLPGRILSTLQPTWVEDVAADPDFPRADVALQAGMRSVVGGPLLAQDGLMGVVEVFSTTARQPDEQQVSDVVLVGQQLGFYLGRRRVEDRLRATEESSASIVHAALDCIITMDHRGRVVDFNPAAETTFGYDRDETIGELLAELIIPPEFRDAHHEALASYIKSRDARILGQRLELTGMRADGSQFPVELTVTRLGTYEPPVFAGFIRDISERRAAEEQLGELLEREQVERARAERAERATRDVAEVLQRSLLPPRLPTIPGLELGAAYRAGTAGWQVGGDFYDVFKLGKGRWAIAIGDVCGKGPRAAALTAMVRYAIRNAAVREARPSDVLAALNAELLADEQGELVTAIYATMDIGDDETCVRMAVGGHPLPLLARADGPVTAVGRSGALLGAVESAQSYDVEFRLSPRDMLLLYTDGVTEAPVTGGRFGESRLSELVASVAGVAKRHPQHVVDHIDEAVGSARLEAGDDVALLAVRLVETDGASRT